MPITKLTITTSSELTPETKKKMEKRLKDKYGDILPIYHIDEAILGGIIIFDGKIAYDGSIKTQLEKIKEKFITNIRDNK